MLIMLNEERIPITNFHENLNRTAMLNAINSFVVTAESEFPDVADLEGIELTSCVITNDDGVRIPTQGFYHKVDGITATYNDRDKVYTLSIVLT